MKIKFLIPLIVLSFILAGCTNDSLPVIINQKFVVDNTNFMKPFSYEIKAGDITKFPSSYQLKSFLFIYDEKGDLFQKQILKSSKYEKLEFALPTKTGKYTLVSISQFCKIGNINSDGNWTIYDEEHLGTLNLTCNGGSKLSGLTGILGIDVRDIDTSSELSESQLEVEMKPVSTLLIYYVRNIHKLGEQGAYCLAINKGTFDIFGATDYIAEKFDSPSKYICEIKPSDYKETTTVVYGYYSILPVGKTAFRYDHCTSSTNTPLTSVFYLTPKSAEEYLIELNLYDDEQNNEITWRTTLVNGVSKAAITEPTIESESEKTSEETVSVLELWNSINEKN